MTRCTICEHAERPQIDALLASGSSVRSVAQMFAVPRTTLGRHKAHAHELPSRFALIDGQADPLGPADPLSEAITLAAKARTPREKLRGLEQVRAATKLRMRGVALAPEDRALLDRNIAEAEAAYKAAGDFETAVRALSGWREAILHRLDLLQAPDAIPMRLQVALGDGEPRGEGTPIRMRPSEYWRGVPAKYHDADRFLVERKIRLRFAAAPRQDGDPPEVEIVVREAATGALAWADGSFRHRNASRT